MQVASVHETARYTSHMLMATDDDCIPGYRRIAEAYQAHDCKLFGQIFHPGRKVLDSPDGTAPMAYAPSAVPNARYHNMPRPLSQGLIGDIVDGYAEAADRFKRAVLDGVEIIASHGYLPSQFLNPRINRRHDEYGGAFENRVRFLFEVAAAVRTKVGDDMVVGMRISGDEKDREGLRPDEVIQACAALDAREALDYYNVIAGTTATMEGALHVVPPMVVETAYVAPFAAAIRAKVAKPVFVAGRINQPQIAEQVLATGQALLAQLLPGRSEFGGIVTNLAREVELAGVRVIKNTEAMPEQVRREAPDAVILTTGARPRIPAIEGADEAHIVDAWQVLRGEANVGASVLVADWRCDWVGIGIAEKLARDGCRVRLAVNGFAAGQNIQNYIRDYSAGVLYRLGVEVILYARLYGVDADSVYLQHTAAGEPIVCGEVDTVVLALGQESANALEAGLKDFLGELVAIGDCASPRTAEEAVLEGLRAGVAL